jgi:hypothetical protein
MSSPLQLVWQLYYHALENLKNLFYLCLVIKISYDLKNYDDTKKKLSTFISTSFTRKVGVLNFLDYLKKQYLPFQYVKRFY